MALITFKSIVDDVGDSCRETAIDTFIKNWVNLTLQEINDPAWAFEQIGRKGYNHLWSFNRRKTTLSVSAETALLPRDLDKLGLIREITTPNKLRYLPDDLFYEYVPYPTATGTPKYYRLWDEEGVSTQLAVADTIDIKSSDAADTSSFTVSIVGEDSNGIIQSEVLTLNGITAVTGSQSFAANKILKVSKSAKTTGNITVMEHSGLTTLVVIGEEEIAPRFRIIGLYPIPSAAVTLYLEYYTRIRNLVNDTDVPDIDQKWIWVIRSGAMAKVYQYQGKESMFQSMQQMYASGVRSMIMSDLVNVDFIPTLKSHFNRGVGVVTYSDLGYGDYGVTY